MTLAELASTIGYWNLIVGGFALISFCAWFGCTCWLYIWDAYKKRTKLNKLWIDFIRVYWKELEYFKEHKKRMP